MFNTDRFIEECRKALSDPIPHIALKEVVERAVSEPSAVERALGPFTEGVVQSLYRADDLTVLNIVWPSNFTIFPHNHNIWAVIGVYGGQEDNIFYGRREGGVGLDRLNGQTLMSKDTLALGDRVIHSVTNPSRLLTPAIHVYGGDFFAVDRSEWGTPEAFEEPYDTKHLMQALRDGNERAKELRAEEA
jgi:predicted metal-dependent enzyme (double-stranded beta helix superfamily)